MVDEVDYGTPDAPSPEEVKTLRTLVREQFMTEQEIERLNLELQHAKDRLKLYSEKLVPAAMEAMGMDAIRTADGIEVKVEKKLQGSFPKDADKQSTAFTYLMESGNAGLIRNAIELKFGPDEDANAAKAAQVLKEAGLAFSRSKTINHQSMLAFIRDELRSGKPIPLTAFGVFEQTTTEIKVKK